jgi:hypothetical protein
MLAEKTATGTGQEKRQTGRSTRQIGARTSVGVIGAIERTGNVVASIIGSQDAQL